jgi:putative addiction module component (TIGR02574 family)
MVNMKEIRQLSVEERILMVEAIWDSIEEDTIGPTSLTKDQEKELLKRIELHESGKGKTYTWDEVRSMLKKEE